MNARDRLLATELSIRNTVQRYTDNDQVSGIEVDRTRGVVRTAKRVKKYFRKGAVIHLFGKGGSTHLSIFVPSMLLGGRPVFHVYTKIGADLAVATARDLIDRHAVSKPPVKDWRPEGLRPKQWNKSTPEERTELVKDSLRNYFSTSLPPMGRPVIGVQRYKGRAKGGEQLFLTGLGNIQHWRSGTLVKTMHPSNDRGVHDLIVFLPTSGGSLTKRIILHASSDFGFNLARNLEARLKLDYGVRGIKFEDQRPSR